MTDTVEPPADAVTIDECRRLLTAPGAPFETADAEVRGVRTRVWVNGPPTLRAMLEATGRHDDRPFMVYEQDRVSYGAFRRAVAALAGRLVADGVEPGDRVAVAMRNLPEWPVAFFACAAIGAIAVALNAWWMTDELGYGLTDSGAVVAVVDGERLARLRSLLPKLPDLRRVYVARADSEAGADATALEDVIGPASRWAALPDPLLPDIRVDADDPAAIFYTSGTTGAPKGAVLSHRNITANTQAAAFGAARAALRAGRRLPSADPEAAPRTTLLPLPFFHVTGCCAILCNLIHQGGKVVLMYKWDAERALELIERERVNVVSGVASMTWELIEHPRRTAFDLSSVDRVSWGGGPSSPELARKVGEIFPRSTPASGWGMTEVSAIHTSNSGVDYARKPDSCGAPVGDYAIRVCDAAGATLPAGDVGELWAQGCNVAIGYWNKPEATAATFVDGWVRTGDIARIDEEGFCFIVDRAKDMLIRGGENIHCQEVERALFEHPGVIDAAVVGIPHRRLGEEPGAVVQLRRGETADGDALRAFAATRLAAFKVPVRIIAEYDSLPRNAAGKVMKDRLRERFAAAAPAVAGDRS